MPYTAPTFAQAKTALASRLNDPSKVRWVDAELGTYLREALRTWNAWTSHFRDQGSFSTTMLQAFYDLPTVIPTQRGYTVTTWELIADLQYALLEPAAAGGTWTGTDQFTLAQLSDAIRGVRDAFLRETGAVLTRSETLYGAPAASGRVALAESVSVVRRAAWRPTATQLLQPLLRTDEWAGTHYKPAWPQATTDPNAYSVSATPPLTLQIIPPPAGAGTLDLVSIDQGASIDPLVSSLLGIPDDWAWVIKYGALAELLQHDGLALDPQRAAYCEARYAQGVQAARAAAVVLDARINGVTCLVASLSEADTYSPLWQLLGGTPNTLLLAGQNLVASWPPPGGAGGPWTIALDVVCNAPVPAIDADILQIGQDVYDAILDLAQHTALIKEGPGQTQTAMALLERASGAAGVEIRIQQASQPARSALLGQQSQDRRALAEQLPPIAQTVEG